MLRIGECVGGITLEVFSSSSNTAKVKSSKVKVTRSNENCAQNIKYIPKTSYWKSRSPEQMAWSDF